MVQERCLVPGAESKPMMTGYAGPDGSQLEDLAGELFARGGRDVHVKQNSPMWRGRSSRLRRGAMIIRGKDLAGLH